MKPIQRNVASAITEHEAKADPHTPYAKHSLATAINDFLVASGAGAFVKKTLAEVKTILGLGSAAYTESSDYAIAAKGVTNGDSHDHNGGDGAQINHASLSNIGTNSHAQIDAHIVAVAPHAGIGDVHECRVDFVSASSIALNAHAGNKLLVNGEVVTISGQACSNTANLLAADGTDSGNSPSASTLYYGYMNNSSGSYAPSSLRLSATAPTLVNGIHYLASSGNGANYRHVCWVYMTSGSQFADSATQALVVSRYNKKKKMLSVCPGYNDNNASTSYTHANAATFNVPSVLASPHLQFISNGDDDIRLFVRCSSSSENAAVVLGIGIDTGTGANYCGLYSEAGASQFQSDSVEGYYSSAIPGYHFANIVLWVSATKTFFADESRIGSVADPARTYILAEVMI